MFTTMQQTQSLTKSFRNAAKLTSGTSHSTSSVSETAAASSSTTAARTITDASPGSQTTRKKKQCLQAWTQLELGHPHACAACHHVKKNIRRCNRLPTSFTVTEGAGVECRPHETVAKHSPGKVKHIRLVHVYLLESHRRSLLQKGSVLTSLQTNSRPSTNVTLHSSRLGPAPAGKAEAVSSSAMQASR